MASKKKWFGLAAIIAAIVAITRRNKRAEDDGTSGSMDT